jgi:hypothetical protein
LASSSPPLSRSWVRLLSLRLSLYAFLEQARAEQFWYVNCAKIPRIIFNQKINIWFLLVTPMVPYRPGDKKQLKAQDVTAKLVRFDILRMVPKKNVLS